MNAKRTRRTATEAAAAPVADTCSDDSDNRAAGAGRPPGTPNRDYDRGERRPGQCRKCKCTESLAEKKTLLPLPNDPDFTHVELIRCKCRRCGQWRIDRQPVNVD